MNIGFSGTRLGCLLEQHKALSALLRQLLEVQHGTTHSGDCVGADHEFHALARELDCWTIGHPPTNPSQRAFCEYHETRPPQPYLLRNARIVGESAVMIACPAEMTEQQRGGTWSTYRLSLKCGKLTFLILPDGTVKRTEATSDVDP